MHGELHKSPSFFVVIVDTVTYSWLGEHRAGPYVTPARMTWLLVQ